MEKAPFKRTGHHRHPRGITSAPGFQPRSLSGERMRSFTPLRWLSCSLSPLRKKGHSNNIPSPLAGEGQGEGAHEKHRFQAGMELTGQSSPVDNPRKEAAEFYKTNSIKECPIQKRTGSTRKLLHTGIRPHL